VKTNTGGSFKTNNKAKFKNVLQELCQNVGHECLHGNWSDAGEVEALLFLAAEFSVVGENLQVNILCTPGCICVSLLL